MTLKERLRLLKTEPAPEPFDGNLPEGAGECLLCTRRANVQLSADDESTLICYEHLGDFLEIWTGPRTSFHLEKIT